jgi:hypothetical protein
LVRQLLNSRTVRSRGDTAYNTQRRSKLLKQRYHLANFGRCFSSLKFEDEPLRAGVFLSQRALQKPEFLAHNADNASEPRNVGNPFDIERFGSFLM